MSKTNAARILDQLGISYELREYEVDPEDLAAESVAVKICNCDGVGNECSRIQSWFRKTGNLRTVTLKKRND